MKQKSDPIIEAYNNMMNACPVESEYGDYLWFCRDEYRSMYPRDKKIFAARVLGHKDPFDRVIEMSRIVYFNPLERAMFDGLKVVLGLTAEPDYDTVWATRPHQEPRVYAFEPVKFKSQHDHAINALRAAYEAKNKQVQQQQPVSAAPLESVTA